MSAGFPNQSVPELAAGLKCLLLDVDGVMTDGGIILVGEDLEVKRFDVHDGMGINLARRCGIKVAVITSRRSTVVERRAKELLLDEVFQGVENKAEILPQVLEKFGVTAAETAFIGDDIQDIPIMSKVGIPIAVQNAIPAVKAKSIYVTGASGGHGAVREAVDWLLELRGDKEFAYGQFGA